METPIGSVQAKAAEEAKKAAEEAKPAAGSKNAYMLIYRKRSARLDVVRGLLFASLVPVAV